MNVEIVPCTLAHLRSLALNARPGDRAELEMAGKAPRHILIDLWMRTTEPKTALIGGKVGACWGLSSSLLSTEGLAWLFTTPEVEKVPLYFFRRAKQEVQEMLRHHHAIVSNIACDYTKAIRFFTLLGFSAGVEQRLGPGQRGFLEIRMER